MSGSRGLEEEIEQSDSSVGTSSSSPPVEDDLDDVAQDMVNKTHNSHNTGRTGLSIENDFSILRQITILVVLLVGHASK